MPKITEVQQQTGRIEELIRKLEASADPDSLATARQLVQSLIELYGAGLTQITEILARKGEYGRQILDELGRDDLVGNLLAANGVHPQDLETRVRRALDKLDARLGSHGSIEMLGLAEGVLRLRLRSTTTGSLKPAIEEAIYEAAPDLAELVIEEIAPQGAANGFVPLEKLAGYRAASANGNGAGL
jgi:hypothetical protein